ncbi:zinc finger protein 501 [Latimeria chalumnae]|uniref:zinc finger protein 501 n=1 Tax=Latimeria chalumnae TaxID=7897 RepID=UPI0003C18E8E|nr:PREDICTED: zinc finger protein 501-like [Latimeria chalumnae]|eukprot:XP_006004218.1 PREDICTED: zinc finger protein 501-like [Latimeria chalumnae]
MEVLPEVEETGGVPAVKIKSIIEGDSVNKEEETQHRNINPRQLEMEKTFEDIEMYFTKGEWEELQNWEKEVYRDIKEHYDAVISFGCDVPKPDFMSEVEDTQQLSVCESLYDTEVESPLPDHNQFSDTVRYTSNTSSHVHSLCNKAPLEKDFETKQMKKTMKENFTLKGNLKTHQQIHSGEKPHKCTECGKGFTQLGNLLLHQRLHTGEKPYKCVECGKSFSRLETLRAHIQIHTGVKPYKCTVCGRSFRRCEHLERHQRIHTGEKPFKCDECGKTFRRSEHRNRHQKVHMEKKSYKCTDCGKSFQEASDLKSHQCIHTGEKLKSYKCDECEKCFTRKGNLKTHQQVHTGVKPYKCTECEKSFSRLCYLKEHKRIHTGEKP